jgi:hypothetical protein
MPSVHLGIFLYSYICKPLLLFTNFALDSSAIMLEGILFFVGFVLLIKGADLLVMGGHLLPENLIYLNLLLV